jgi:hypothetical protein
MRQLNGHATLAVMPGADTLVQVLMIVRDESFGGAWGSLGRSVAGNTDIAVLFCNVCTERFLTTT